jgi:hypothetical protein
MLSSRHTRTYFIGFCLALGPLGAGFFVYKGMVDSKASDHYITVQGLAECMEKSNRGSLNLQFKVSAEDLPQLYREREAAIQLIQGFIKKNGFLENEIALGAPRFSDRKADGYSAAKGIRYTIDQSIEVNSKKVDTLQDVSEKISTLVTGGVPVTSTVVNFYLDGYRGLRPQLIVDSMKNAQDMAESIVKTTGQKLGGIRRVNPMTSINAVSSDRSWPGNQALMKKVRVMATVEFFIH